MGSADSKDTAEAENGTQPGLGVLDAARAGDPDAFARLTEPYRRSLLAHCYRLLGSLADAEDQVQETLLAAWRGMAGFEGGSVAQLRAWLYRIATNRCLNARRDLSRRPPPEPTPPFAPPEPTRRGDVPWLQPYPDRLLPSDEAAGPEARYETRESVELAFVVALQRMPPRQAAVLVLRDVLGYPANEVAAQLGTSTTAVKGLLQRARGTLPSGSAPDAVAPGSAQERALLARFVEAFTADDVDAVVALLTDDAWLAMPPARHEYVGPDAVAAFLRAGAAWRPGRRLRLRPTRANGQPAFGCYLDAADGGDIARPAGLVVLTLAGSRVQGITRFLGADVFEPFGLPAELPGRSR